MRNYDQSVDARGLNCPLPILRIGKALNDMATGEVVRMVATDPGSQNDMASFCAQTGHDLLSSETRDADFIYVVRKN